MNKLLKLSCLSLFLLMAASVSSASLKDYRYETVPNDPLKARIYTLDNGLKVYMTVNKEQPRIQTYIAVRVGGKNDPAETTGLAHYFEHLMFKGTKKFGTQNYEAEKPLLDQIEQQFEIYRKTTDEAERTAIYHKIDSLSYEASKLAIPNEYDKLMAAIGATGTNAYTSFDQTVYEDDIPSNHRTGNGIRREKHVADQRSAQGIRNSAFFPFPTSSLRHPDRIGNTGRFEKPFHHQYQKLSQGMVCAQ